MKCPLLQYYEDVEDYADRYVISDCLKEECAWWNANAGACSVYLISRNLMGIFDIGADIKDKISQR